MSNEPRGNDGLTDEEREKYAQNYLTCGAGRPLTAEEQKGVTEWVKARQTP